MKKNPISALPLIFVVAFCVVGVGLLFVFHSSVNTEKKKKKINTDKENRSAVSLPIAPISKEAEEYPPAPLGKAAPGSPESPPTSDHEDKSGEGDLPAPSPDEDEDVRKSGEDDLLERRIVQTGELAVHRSRTRIVRTGERWWLPVLSIKVC